MDVTKTEFATATLGDMVAVGAVTQRSARLWLRSQSAGTCTLAVWPVDAGESAASPVTFDVGREKNTDGTISLLYPTDFEDVPPLLPGTRYAYRISRGGHTLGQGAFETSPVSADSAPDRFAIAAMSCHQPFDDDGDWDGLAFRALKSLRGMLGLFDVKRVLLTGDQMYSDMPAKFSLFDGDWFEKVAPPGRASVFECTREEVRQLWHTRYRTFWAEPFFRGMQADYPCYPMVDDHEMRDNFGSAPEHATPKWQAIRDGSLDAYRDYQGLRVDGLRHEPSRPLYYDWEYGPVACFVMDLRSQRRATEDEIQILGRDQKDAITHWLELNATRDVLILMASVPLMQVPDFLSDIGAWVTGEASDFADRWSYAKATKERDWVLTTLRDHQAKHPKQKIIIVGGDVHVGAISRFVWRERTDVPPLFQMASSAVSNAEMPLLRRFAALMPLITKQVRGKSTDLYATCEMVKSDDEAHTNPFGGLNVGFVELVRAGSGWDVHLCLASHGDNDGDPPRLIYRSPAL